MVTSKISYNNWLDMADQSYLAARELCYFFALFFPMAYVGHHALELYFKAIHVKETGTYNKNHNLRELHNLIEGIDPTYRSAEVNTAIDKFLNYHEVGRYSRHETELEPINYSMGTDMIKSLDSAVLKLRDLSIKTSDGLDKIVTIDVPTLPYIKPKYSALYYQNDSFKPIRSAFIDSLAPRF